jgi:hypothetical protein
MAAVTSGWVLHRCWSRRTVLLRVRTLHPNSCGNHFFTVSNDIKQIEISIMSDRGFKSTKPLDLNQPDRRSPFVDQNIHTFIGKMSTADISWVYFKISYIIICNISRWLQEKLVWLSHYTIHPISISVKLDHMITNACFRRPCRKQKMMMMQSKFINFSCDSINPWSHSTLFRRHANMQIRIDSDEKLKINFIFFFKYILYSCHIYTYYGTMLGLKQQH